MYVVTVVRSLSTRQVAREIYAAKNLGFLKNLAMYVFGFRFYSKKKKKGKKKPLFLANFSFFVFISLFQPRLLLPHPECMSLPPLPPLPSLPFSSLKQILIFLVSYDAITNANNAIRQ